MFHSHLLFASLILVSCDAALLGAAVTVDSTSSGMVNVDTNTVAVSFLVFLKDNDEWESEEMTKESGQKWFFECGWKPFVPIHLAVGTMEGRDRSMKSQNPSRVYKSRTTAVLIQQ